MNWRRRNQLAGKMFAWCMVIFMISTTLFANSVHAANGWSQYGKIGSEHGSGLGEFGYPLGVATDSQGNVYVADYDNNRIQKLDVSTGVWSAWGKGGVAAGSGLGEFNSPSGIAVDSNDNIYVADKLNHRIQKRDAITGTWSKWGKNYNGPNVLDYGWGTNPGEFHLPTGVAVDHDGNVYVADTTNQRLQMLDAATGKWTAWGKSGQSTGNKLGEFKQLTGVAVDSKGIVYVADYENHRIQKATIEKSVINDENGNAAILYTPTWSEFKKNGGGPGSGLGEFDEPYGVAVDKQGNLYVADSNNHRIQKLLIATNKWSKWSKDYDGPDVPDNGYGSDLGEFDYPTGVAIDHMGNVYVADYNNHRIQKLAKYMPLSAGGFHSVAIQTDGKVWTWGANSSGQLGLGDAGFETNRKTPVQVMKEDGTGFIAVQVAAGGSHTAALDPDKHVWTWGSNTDGQLGSAGSSRNKPYRVDNIADVTAIAAGTSHTAALKGDGTVWTWGSNGEGQLGLGNLEVRAAQPKQVMLADGTTPLIAKSIFAGYNQTLAIDLNGTLWMWGSQGDSANTYLPVKVTHSDGSDFKAVAAAAGLKFTVALDDTGKVWVWGYNGTAGALGIGVVDNGTIHYPLTQVSGLTDIIAIDAGSMHTLALKQDGTVWAWGNNENGQVGNLSNVNSSVPVNVLNQDGNIFRNAVAISAGGDNTGHSLAMKKDGSIIAWGTNEAGQLGNGKNVGKNYAEVVAGSTFTVTFDSQGGSEVVPLSEITKNTKITAPDAPTRKGYSFAGWYTDSGYNVPWVFEADTVTANLILYAKWKDQTYSITPISNQTLSELTVGYASGTQETKSIAITRTGTGVLENVYAAISGTNAGSFEITAPQVTKLDNDTPSTAFSIKVKDGLAAGIYTATVTVKATNMTDVVFNVTQTVKKSSDPDPIPTYTIAPINNQTLTELTAGYPSGSKETKSITITRTGTGVLENVYAAISGTNAGSFEITAPQVTKLDKDTPSTAFTIKAKDGLAAGIYTTTVTVKATNMTDVVFNVTQTVKSPTHSNPDSTPTTGSPSTSTKEEIVVDVRAGEGDVISKTPITRTTEPNGMVKDEVILTSERAKEAVDQLKNKTDKTARIVIPDEKDKVSQIDVKLPVNAIGTLVAGQANFEIYTNNVRIVIPRESLDNFNKDLYFRLVPIKQDSERKLVEERAKKEEQIREIAKGQEIKLLGRPMTIDTNMQSRPVALVLPLKDSLPQNEAERQAILDNLVIFVEHSDGTKELIRGELVAYKQGEKGIRFSINKFSTFSMVYMKGIGTHKPYINGFIDGTFGPEKTVTRAQMAAMLARNLETAYKGNGTSSFKDIDVLHWAFQDMEIVNQDGLMQGYTDERFGPEEGITRAEMAVIVDRWMAKQGKASGSPDHDTIYTDLTDKHWAYQAIMHVRGYSIMEGYQGNAFAPNQKLTRAEAVKILNRLFNRGPLYGVKSPSFTDVASSDWAFYEIEEAAKAHQWVKDDKGKEIEK
ncbi:hypothetical protein BC351_02345 [Paenibacillus ferrarius]|uniref:SLH domain-containing protein n=1 Tax=Paenibacillus ferrarius TaxID=1469647 RepID=A0A1V4HT35_9BACL|nr:S-layer homology domain-containing protein [Paenibacillus ferrarius]OPH62099.1 hypothetical protein BC351_02345 [Paenibacillus ferrarius]